MTTSLLDEIETQLDDGLEAALTAIAREAGAEILAIYEESADVEIDRKADDSPLTEADLASNRAIEEGLAELGVELPVLSEESKQIAYDTRRTWGAFWLVDPLDGTKEFIKRNGEFTVNIALVQDGHPIAGIVHAPDLGTTYYGQAGAGAFLTSEDGQRSPLKVQTPGPDEPLGVVVSRSHLNDETQAFVDRLAEAGREVDLVPSGSSLKFCRIAEGQAHVYPRLAPTMEWDTGAAQIVLEAAGGVVIRADDREPLVYNKEELLNPHFIAAADKGLIPRREG